MNTLYRKSLLYYLLALILGFSFLGLGITEAFKNYFYSEKRQFILNQAIEISELYKHSYYNDPNISYFIEEIGDLDEYSSYNFFITDTNFTVIAKAKEENILNIGSKVDFDKKDIVLNGEKIFSTDNFNKLYTNDVYYISYPVKVANDVIAVVFVTTSVSKLHASISKIYILCIIFIIIAAILGFAVLSVSMSKTLSGITKLNNAAKKIALGNFDERIELKGNDELSQLANSFNDMAKSLSESEKYKQEFLSNIAHDIRSPITSITGFLDAILDGTIPAEKINKYLNIIKSETNRLNKLTNSILDLNKVLGINQQIIEKDFFIDELIINTVESIRSRTYEKNLSMEFDFEKDKINVSADYEKIQRVLYNLYDNAIKFSSKNGTIKSSVYVKNNKAHVSISNTGKGLTEDECKRVFDRLYKTDSSRGMDKTGMGLGLSIVKEFINMHNETITVESEFNKNTTFTFTLKIKN